MVKSNHFEVRTFLALVLLSAAILVLDLLVGLGGIRRISEQGLVPIYALGGWLKKQVDGPVDFFRLVNNGKRRVEDLERQVAELNVKALKAEDLERENTALREIVKAPPVRQYQLIPAKVVARGEEWLVAFDSQTGLAEGAAVVTKSGALLGVVVSVGEYVAKVRPLTHPGLRVEAITDGGTSGTVVGETGKGIRLEQVLQEDSLSAGDRVVTSGAKDKLAAGILIGQVERVYEMPSQVYKSASLKALFLLDEARNVFIVQQQN